MGRPSDSLSRAVRDFEIVRRYAAGEGLAALRDLAAQSTCQRVLIRELGPQRYRRVARDRIIRGAMRAAEARGCRKWSQEEERLFRNQYGTVTAAALAGKLGCKVEHVFAKAHRLGLASHYAGNRRADLERRLRKRNAEGWPDAEIAREFGCERHTVSRLRVQLALPYQGRSARARARIAAKTRQQLARAGLRSLAEVRTRSHRMRARRGGWPEDLKIRQVEIMELLLARGPMTRDQIGEALGMGHHRKANSPRGWWYQMMCNPYGGHGATSYMADLIRRGLVVNLGRCVRNGPPGRQQGHNTALYAPALWLERKLT